MTKNQQKQITKLSRLFTIGLGIPINKSGWIIVDPLSAYLSACGFENIIQQIPENEKHSQVLFLIFKDGSRFIPAGKDLQPINKTFKNWQWL